MSVKNKPKSRFLIILIQVFIILNLFNKLKDKTFIPKPDTTLKILPTVTPCYSLATIDNPISSKIKNIYNSYNLNIKKWPLVNQKLITKTFIHHGIKIYVTDSNYYTDKRIELLINAINISPQILLDNRPQSIYLVTLDSLNYSTEKN